MVIVVWIMPYEEFNVYADVINEVRKEHTMSAEMEQTNTVHAIEYPSTVRKEHTMSAEMELWKKLSIPDEFTITIDQRNRMIHIGAENHHMMNDVYGDDMVKAIEGTEYDGFLIVFWHKGNMDGVLDRGL